LARDIFLFLCEILLKNEAWAWSKSVVKLYFEIAIRGEKTIKTREICVKMAFIWVFEILVRHYF